MIKPFFASIVVFFFIFFSYRGAVAQNTQVDSLQRLQTLNNIIDAFNSAMGLQSFIYNGVEYAGYEVNKKTNANFKDTIAYTLGSVNYAGIVYTNVPLFYDIYADLLVSRYNGISPYTLANDDISCFDLLNHHFVKIDNDITNTQITAGFYDDIYHHKLQLIGKYRKIIKQAGYEELYMNKFVEQDKYFLKKGALYYNVSSEGMLLDALKDKKKELKQYIKDNKLSFKSNYLGEMVLLASYYDSLTN